MKFRTDFVTNSSNSSFLAFNIKNEKLFNKLIELGFRIDNTPPGMFTDRMRVVLPSGVCRRIDGANDWRLPRLDEFKTISEWVVALIAYGNDYDDLDFTDIEDLDEFTREAETLLRDAGLFETAASYEDTLKSATIEQNKGFEGQSGPLIYTEITAGSRTSYLLNELLDDEAWEVTYKGGVKEYAEKWDQIVNSEDFDEDEYEMYYPEDYFKPTYQEWKNGRWQKVNDK